MSQDEGDAMNQEETEEPFFPIDEEEKEGTLTTSLTKRHP